MISELREFWNVSQGPKGHIQKGRRNQWKFNANGDISQPYQVVPPTLFKNAIDILVNICLQSICTDLESKKEPVIHSIHLKKIPHQTPLLKLWQKIGS